MEGIPIPFSETRRGIDWARVGLETKAFAIESLVNAGVPPHVIINGIIYTGNNPWNTTTKG